MVKFSTSKVPTYLPTYPPAYLPTNLPTYTWYIQCKQNIQFTRHSWIYVNCGCVYKAHKFLIWYGSSYTIPYHTILYTIFALRADCTYKYTNLYIVITRLHLRIVFHSCIRFSSLSTINLRIRVQKNTSLFAYLYLSFVLTQSLTTPYTSVLAHRRRLLLLYPYLLAKVQQQISNAFQQSHKHNGVRRLSILII